MGRLDRSGVSVVEFARSQGIRPETLYRWSCERRKRMANTVPAAQELKAPQFVELDLIGNSKPEPLIVHLGSISEPGRFTSPGARRAGESAECNVPPDHCVGDRGRNDPY